MTQRHWAPDVEEDEGEDLGAELLADELEDDGACCFEAPRSSPDCPCAAGVND